MPAWCGGLGATAPMKRAGGHIYLQAASKLTSALPDGAPYARGESQHSVSIRDATAYEGDAYGLLN